MRPLSHIVTTLVAFTIIKFFYCADPSLLLYSLALTLGIDAVDHTLSLFIINHKMRKAVMPMMMKWKIDEAYNFYAENRFKYNRMLLHTYLFFFLWIIVGLYFQSIPVFLGLVLHYVLDIIDSYFHGRIWSGNLLKEV